jgi:hypothetical protein
MAAEMIKDSQNLRDNLEHDLIGEIEKIQLLLDNLNAEDHILVLWNSYGA